MKKSKLLMTIVAGLTVSQAFAEGDRLFKVSNTVRFGYNDNVYQRSDNEEGSAYLRDTIDFALDASLSDRTDVMLKSKMILRTDKESDILPSLYGVIRHSASPRVLLELSDMFVRDNVSTADSDGRRNYLTNKLGFKTTYIATDKDRIEGSVNHSIRRGEDEVKSLDYDRVGGGVAWVRDIRPQRTSARVSVNQSYTEYNERDSSYNSTRIVGGLSHTFSENWQGTAYAGATYTETDISDTSDSYVSPYVDAGLVYSPTPATSFSGNYTFSHQPSSSSSYGAQTSGEFRFVAQHDVTARILAKALFRYRSIEYSADDAEVSGLGDSDQNLMDIEFKVSYKINRLNSFEVNLRHRDQEYENNAGDWDQNMVDCGWRVDL